MPTPPLLADPSIVGCRRTADARGWQWALMLEDDCCRLPCLRRLLGQSPQGREHRQEPQPLRPFAASCDFWGQRVSWLYQPSGGLPPWPRTLEQSWRGQHSGHIRVDTENLASTLGSRWVNPTWRHRVVQHARAWCGLLGPGRRSCYEPAGEGDFFDVAPPCIRPGCLRLGLGGIRATTDFFPTLAWRSAAPCHPEGDLRAAHDATGVFCRLFRRSQAPL